MAPKALITGGAGFIGSHAAAALAERGYHVTILDDLSTGKPENLVPLPGKPGFEFIQGSVTDTARLARACWGVQYVFHLAAIASVPASLDDPLTTHNVNAGGTLNTLIAARDAGVKKVVFASSAAVYGDDPSLPNKEDAVPLPLSPYAVTKLAGEYYCSVFQRAYGLSAVCLRFFNVYGPRQNVGSAYASVIPAFIKRVLAGEPPAIFGDGEATRDFIYVKDAAEACMLMAEKEVTGVYNIGAGKGVSINELARLVTRITGKNVSPVYREERPGDIRHSLADTTKARASGYIPRYSLEQGLKETIDWLRKS